MVKIVIVALPVVASAVGSCSDLCKSGGHGDMGFISGTAPACGGHCEDCGNNFCYRVEKGSVSDYGHGCSSGNKVCCCSSASENALFSDESAASTLKMASVETEDFGSSTAHCSMYHGTCGSGSCSAASGQTCHDCSTAKICCVEPKKSGEGNCNTNKYGHDAKCGAGNCVASAGQSCSDCSTTNWCAVCHNSVSHDDAMEWLHDSAHGNKSAASPVKMASASEDKSDVAVGSCSDLCKSGGHGDMGFISGTAPACGGHCEDCGNNFCYRVEKGSVSDYGHGCSSGNKVCCCSSAMV